MILNKEIEETSPLNVASTFTSWDFDPATAFDFVAEELGLSDDPEEICITNDTSLKPKNSNICPSPARNLMFHNIDTHQQIPVPCNKYSCPVCGKKKARILYQSLVPWLQQFQYVRFWTITLSGAIVTDTKEHYKVLQEAWRRFITEIRRNKALSPAQRDFQYVRVAEVHEGHHGKYSNINNLGKIHFHVFVDCYIDWKLVNAIWNHCCQELTGVPGKNGNIKMKGMLKPERAAKYVTNYVLKSAELLEAYQKKWTKSGKTGIIFKRQSTGKWLIINLLFPLEDQICQPLAENYYNLNHISTSSQSIGNLPPPLCLFSELVARKDILTQKIYDSMI
jgi:hypothetical protein